MGRIWGLWGAMALVGLGGATAQAGRAVHVVVTSEVRGTLGICG